MIRVSSPGQPWEVSYRALEPLFVASAVKCFINLKFLGHV